MDRFVVTLRFDGLSRMRFFFSMPLALAVLVSSARAEDKKKADSAPVRYGIAADLRTYPQGSAREAFASVLKAIDAKRIDYLLAQLSAPAFIDERVKRLFGGKFDQQVAETQTKLDPSTVKQLRRFQEKGEWSEEGAKVLVTLKDLPERVIQLRKIGARWYLENHNRPERTGK